MLRRYRAAGADLPFGNPLAAHGVAMEGYFWRLTDRRSGRVLVALCGVHRHADGTRWSNVALAAHPGDVIHAADLPHGVADPRALGVRAGDGAFVADARRVRLDLGPQARLDVELHDVRGWTRRAFGGLGVAHVIPGLSQHWHPYVLGARARGVACIDGETIDLAGYDVYAEKNWGVGGFPDRWWWGQALSFPDADACVAFAGGNVGLGPLRTTATALVVRIENTLIRLGDPVLSPTRTDLHDGRWKLRARGPRWEVTIDAQADPAGAHLLPVPIPQERRSELGAVQHFTGELRVEVRRRGRPVFAGTSTLAGLEHGGPAALTRALADRAPHAPHTAHTPHTDGACAPGADISDTSGTAPRDRPCPAAR